MGQTTGAICKTCGHTFEVRSGGGFTFHLLHCKDCGREKSVTEREMGDAFPQESGAWFAMHVPPCVCGGRFTVDAQARCPKCRGTDFEPDPNGGICMYD